MERNKETKIHRWVIPLFLILGILFFAIGTFFIMKIKGHSWYEIGYILAFEAAVIFFTATLIETLLLSEFGNRAVTTMKKLGQTTQTSIDNRLNEIFEKLRNAEYNGVINILPPRRDISKDTKGVEHGELTMSHIRDALCKAKKVKIFCVSGREFLWPREKSGFYDIFFQKPIEEPNYEVQILVASDYGAKIRGKKEYPREPDYILEDVERSIKEKNNLNETVGKEIIKVKYYNFFPQAWYIITDDIMFLETYHMGDTTILKDHWKEKFSDNDGCCGGRVPIFVLQRDSTLYDAMNNYFDWLWTHDDQEIFCNELDSYFNIKDDKSTAANRRS